MFECIHYQSDKLISEEGCYICFTEYLNTLVEKYPVFEIVKVRDKFVKDGNNIYLDALIICRHS
jgi:hypothetical protein